MSIILLFSSGTVLYMM